MKLFTTQNTQADSSVNAYSILNAANKQHGPLAENELSYGGGALSEDTLFDRIGIVIIFATIILVMFTVLAVGSIVSDVHHNDGFFSFASFALVIFVALALGVILSQLPLSIMDNKELRPQKAIFARNVKWVAKNLDLKEDVAIHLLRFGYDYPSMLDVAQHRYLRINEDTVALYSGVTNKSSELVLLHEAKLDQEFHDMLKTEKIKIQA